MIANNGADLFDSGATDWACHLPASFPRCDLTFRASFGLRRFATTQALTPAAVTSTTGLPACSAQTSQHSASNNEGDPVIALTAIFCAHPYQCHNASPALLPWIAGVVKLNTL